MPVAKGRPRMTKRGFAYTPAKTRKYEGHARLAAQLAMAGAPPFDGPLSIDVHAMVKIPKSWSKKRRSLAVSRRIAATKRPDADNYLKIALDAMNTIVFNDDSQIVDARISKTYSESPKLIVYVHELSLEPA